MPDRKETQRETQKETQTEGSLLELWDLLEEFDTAFLVTLTADKMLRARPMAVQDPDEIDDCDLWFVTSRDTAKVGEVEKEEQVGVVCYRERDKAYVSISAKCRVDRDRETIRRVWRPEFTAWLPGGPEDPTVCLLKMEVERAEYWEPEGGRLRILFDVVKGLVSGRSAAEMLNPPKHI